MHCGRCGVQWDVDDPDRPMCQPDNYVNRSVGLAALSAIKQSIVTPHTCMTCASDHGRECALGHWAVGRCISDDLLIRLKTHEGVGCQWWDPKT